ncbi:hypothetical protein LX32DRAFT_701079 [Colletotrichum zoysiae]|uniref:Uncharacterized protein n=1 Tax=Colletotrichum zoysiae TaxID=1216348 RepID=A0AAD9HE58_9PEZI|nr:hypothetical protein LX32DRAFT_701079 [Colletotrichum zoysiae]
MASLPNLPVFRHPAYNCCDDTLKPPKPPIVDPDSTLDILVRHVAFFGVTGLTVFKCLRHALDDPTLVCHVYNTRGIMENSYISEEAVYTVVAALLAGFETFGSRERPRIVSIGTISITRQIYRSRNPLAVRARPLYEWFIGKQEESDPSRRNPIHRGDSCVDTSSDTASDTSSDHTTTQLSYDGSCSSKNNEIGIDYESSDDSSTSSGVETDTEVSEVESASSMEARSADADKCALEKAIWHHYPCFSSCLIVRPTLLTYDKPYGLWAVRIGEVGNSAPGYTIARRDVAEWLYYFGILGAHEGTVTITT